MADDLAADLGDQGQADESTRSKAIHEVSFRFLAEGQTIYLVNGVEIGGVSGLMVISSSWSAFTCATFCRSSWTGPLWAGTT